MSTDFITASAAGTTSTTDTEAVAIWNVATETGAAWKYSGLPLTSLCELGGVWIGAGTAGLYVFDQAVDGVAAIGWKTKTGLMDFGALMLKRMESVDVVGVFANPPIAKLVVAVGNDKRAWWFRAKARNHDSEDHVVSVGKGIKYYYAQMLIQGSGAARIERLNLYPVVLDRRR